VKYKFDEHPITLAEDVISNPISLKTISENCLAILINDIPVCHVKKDITNSLHEHVLYSFTLESEEISLSKIFFLCFCNKILTFDSYWDRE